MGQFGHHAGRFRSADPNQNEPANNPAQSPFIAMYVAGEDLSGHVIVRVRDNKAWNAGADDSYPGPYQVVGMTSGAAKAGEMATVVQRGPCGGASGLDTTAVYFLGSNGMPPSTSPPDTGWWLTVGTAQDSSTYNVKVGTPVLRN